MLDFGTRFNAILLVLGIVWLHRMLPRWKSDLTDFRSSTDNSEKAAIALVWAVTIWIGIAVFNFVWALLRNIGNL